MTRTGIYLVRCKSSSPSFYLSLYSQDIAAQCESYGLPSVCVPIDGIIWIEAKRVVLWPDTPCAYQVMDCRLKAVASAEPHHGTRERIHLVIVTAERESLYLIQEGPNPRSSEKADVAYLCLAADRTCTF